MPRKPSKATGIEWAHELRAELCSKTKQPPANQGWATRTEIANDLGCGLTSVRAIIISGIERKKIEVFRGTMATSGGIKTCLWYRKKT